MPNDALILLSDFNYWWFFSYIHVFCSHNNCIRYEQLCVICQIDRWENWGTKIVTENISHQWSNHDDDHYLLAFRLELEANLSCEQMRFSVHWAFQTTWSLLYRGLTLMCPHRTIRLLSAEISSLVPNYALPMFCHYCLIEFLSLNITVKLILSVTVKENQCKLPIEFQVYSDCW
jgi:hypothetical protein